jgi:predicted transcriptional regulator
MDDYLQEALEIVKAQAKVRTMSEEEIISMVHKLSEGIRAVCQGGQPVEEVQSQVAVGKSIKEQSVVCLECGKSFKILTKRHLALHGLDADAYREKWGIKSRAPLVCKSSQRERRKKMKSMRLWERRKRS